MPNIPTEPVAAAFQQEHFSFAVSQLAISQNAVALKRNVNAATSGALNITSVVAQFAGSIVGVRLNSTANKTAGAASVTPTINGTAISTPASLVAVAWVNATLKINKQVDAQQVGARFNAGDLIGVKITTDGSYAPTTNDVEVIVDVVYENVQN